jgi:hypothetical protein
VSQQVCATAEQIQAFLLGQLDQEQADELALHLASCPVCSAVTDHLDQVSDAMLHWLRKARLPLSHTTLPPDAAARSTPDQDTAVAAPVRPQRVSGYEVLGELGRGGTSVVYLARQLHPSRLVALKMLLAGGHARSTTARSSTTSRRAPARVTPCPPTTARSSTMVKHSVKLADRQCRMAELSQRVQDTLAYHSR